MEAGSKGRILKGIGGFYYVETEAGEVFACRARGIFRKDGQKPLVGDYVRMGIVDAEKKEGSVDALLPRENALIRPEAANVELALLVFACTSPEPSLLLLDRFLVMLRSQGVKCVLLFNKKDLTTAERISEFAGIYRNADAEVCCISAKSDDIEKIRERIQGYTALLAGPSGVGKSTILNRLCPEAQASTGEISRKLGRGKHTTRHAELFRTEAGSYLMDTPGFTALSLGDMPEEEIRLYYPEFRPYEGKCRFRECSHTHEPGCAVREAVVQGRIHPVRHGNYAALYEEQKQRKKY
ncbi:MAG: ribosome small subunit-dependent GTPase A [Lachnospiraceae bacterium]|nr:ribosome small subunit-dependent GTPase A [Lachnospiraceae bacterium]